MKDGLLEAIESKTANVVVLGLGYVGLPVACLFAEAGFPVVGIDRIRDKVETINRGQSPSEGKEPGLAELVSAQNPCGVLHPSRNSKRGFGSF